MNLRATLLIQIYRPGLGTALMLKSTFSPADEILDWETRFENSWEKFNATNSAKDD